MNEYNIEYYMTLPYTRVLRRDEDGDVVARVDELPGCVAHGETDAEALDNLADIQRGWIEARIASNLRVPEPATQALPSGKWVQRVPRSIHRELTSLAQREGVSLNHLVSVVLSVAMELLRAGGLQLFTRNRDVSHTGCWDMTTDDSVFEVKGGSVGTVPSSTVLWTLFNRIPDEGRIDNEEYENYEKAHRRGR